jgi:hypothetical protein
MPEIAPSRPGPLWNKQGQGVTVGSRGRRRT